MMAGHLRTDAELLTAARRDPAAFAAFYDRHAVAVLGFFARRTACAATAADLTAETFAQAYASRRRYRDTGDPATAWLFAIARHQLAGFLRRQAVDDRARRRLGIAPAALLCRPPARRARRRDRPRRAAPPPATRRSAARGRAPRRARHGP